MLPALCGPAVLCLILFGFARLTGGYFCPGFYFCMDRVLFISVFAFRHSAWLYFVVMLCFLSVVLEGRVFQLLGGG